MIIYNVAKIEGNNLILDFNLENKPYYRNTKILGVRIDTPDTYNTKKAYCTDNIDGANQYTGTINIMGVNNKLLIVTPIIELALPIDSPCGSDVINKTAVYNKNILLNKGVNYLSTINNSCEISKEFIDFILKSKALDIAISSCNYGIAIKLWNKLSTNNITSNGCKCS